MIKTTPTYSRKRGASSQRVALAVAVASAIAFFLALVPAHAGPPLICHPFDIGDAESLPWGTGAHWGSVAPGYAIDSLLPDTLALLTPEMPVLVRMETLRRAAIYAKKRPDAARELFDGLLSRLHAGGDGKAGAALARFDAGYFAEAFKQVGYLQGSARVDSIRKADGYRWILEALEQSPDDAAMHFAAAMVRFHSPDDHLRAAYRLASDGTLVRQNLDRHFPNTAARF